MMFCCRYWEGANHDSCHLFVILLSLPVVILLSIVVGPCHFIVFFLSSSLVMFCHRLSFVLSFSFHFSSRNKFASTENDKHDKAMTQT